MWKLKIIGISFNLKYKSEMDKKNLEFCLPNLETKYEIEEFSRNKKDLLTF